MATIVDPRFKDRFFSSNISKSIAKEAVQEELRKISGASDSEANASASESRTDSPSPKKQKRGSLLELFSDILDDSCADDSSSTNELDCYLRESVLDYKMGKPFTWWAEHHSISNITIIARICNIQYVILKHGCNYINMN